MEEKMTKGQKAGSSPIEFEVVKGKSYYWCSCGKSKKQPFCDSSHKGSEFNPIVYKKMHWDLYDISTKDLIKHFYNYGIKEGRKYKPSQKSSPPHYLVEYINENGLDFLFS